MSYFYNKRKENAEKLKVAIIGAGIGGIASAIRIAAKGYEVDVFEANSYAGGKLSEVQGLGYRFDAGPSLFTMPHLVDELFKVANKDPKDFFTYERLSVICKYFFEDSTIFTAYADKKSFLNEAKDKLEIDAALLERFFKKSRFLYETLSPLFMEQSLHRINTFLSKKAFQAYLRIPRLDFFRTMNKANELLFKNEKVVQLFNRYATYNGSNPYLTPATLNIIPHLEYEIGAYFPQGGMYSITNSLVDLARGLGVKFFFNTAVNKVITKDRKAIGIEVAGDKLDYPLIISNMDVVNSYKKLLPEVKAPERILNQPKSSSALIFYWGIKGVFDELELHNIFFSKDYKTEFDHIFSKNTISDDPTVYINISSKKNSTDAPPGCENWFTMINVPNNSGQDWDSLIAQAKKNILNKLSRITQRDIESLIEYESILDPRSIESKTSSFQGALYGNASNNMFAAFLRHSNFSTQIKNLYFCGGSVHPGGGIPLSLLSAKIVADFIPNLNPKNV